MEFVIQPQKGLDNITFGMTKEEVTNILGTPSYYENLDDFRYDDDDEDSPILYYEYEEIGLNAYFEPEEDTPKLTYLETINLDAVLFGVKVFDLKPDELVKMMKQNGASLSDTDTEDGETRFSFDNELINFFFDGQEMVSITWSAR